VLLIAFESKIFL